MIKKNHVFIDPLSTLSWFSPTRPITPQPALDISLFTG